MVESSTHGGQTPSPGAVANARVHGAKISAAVIGASFTEWSAVQLCVRAVVPITAAWKHEFTQGLLRFGVVGVARTTLAGFNTSADSDACAHLVKQA